MKKVTISFKRTTRDMTLYMEVMKQEEKSDFIKKAIEYYVKSKLEEEIDNL